MDAHQSNLSSSNYGYDMVVATTQNAINATMKEFLAQADTKEINICYVYDDSGALVTADYDTLVKQAGIDPFSIASGTYHKTDPVAKLDDVGFAFAYRAQMGLPNVLPKDLPDIIVLNKGNELVTYQLYCQEFSILNLEESGGGRNLTWTNVTQPDDKPWILSINVNLDLRADNSADAFSKLPPSVQQNIKNLNPDSAFSVQQLYLDLNTAGLDSLPQITGLDPSSNAFTYLTKVFIDTYFKNLSSGDVILGYAVTPQTLNPNPIQPSIIPTDLNIMVSPSLTAGGDANPQDQGLYTLNYLVMTDNNKMPAPVQFTWNWVEDSQASDFEGVMSVKRGTFVNYLNKKLSAWLSNVCLVPNVKVTTDSGGTVTYDPHIDRETNPQTFTVEPSGAKLLSFNYSKDSYDQAGLNGALGTLDLKYTIDSEVSCTGTQLIIDTTSTIYMDISALSGHAKGNALKYEATLTYDFGVDANGDITVSGGTPDIKDQSDNVDSDVWGSIINFLSGGKFQEIISDIKGYLHNDSFLVDDFDTFIKSTLQNNNFWIFPGSKTFIFKDVFFSDNQDMVTHVTYVEPS